MAAGMHHYGVTVSDLERSGAFYREHFGLREIGRFPLSGPRASAALGADDVELVCLLLAGEDYIVELLGYTHPEQRPYGLGNPDIGAAHLCFSVDDLDALYASMSAAGVPFFAPPQELVEGTKMCYCRDPDGISVEILQPGPGITAAELMA